jgi:hypothetical protein
MAHWEGGCSAKNKQYAEEIVNKCNGYVLVKPCCLPLHPAIYGTKLMLLMV